MPNRPRLQRPHALALNMLALMALALPLGAAYAHDEAIDDASVNQLATATNQLIAAVGAYHRAAGSQRNAAAAQLKKVARERRI